jgi:hypothetical protein
MIGFIDTLYTVLGNTGNYSAIADLHTLQFTVAHALGFSVVTSRILTTDLQQCHHNFKWHMKASFHGLITFLSLFCNCQFRRLGSIQFLCPEADILAGWRLETRFDWTLLYNHFARTTQKTQPLYCWEGVLTASLHSNRSYSIVACVFVAAGMCLPSRCLALNMYSDFAIPAL